MSLLLANKNWFDNLLSSAHEEKKECIHEFVTRVVIDTEEIWQPDRWHLLNSSSEPFPHESILAIAKQDVFCKLCLERGSSVE